VEDEAQVAGESGADLRVLVGRVVVQDQVDVFVCRRVTIGLVEEADELFVPRRCMLQPMNGAVEHVEGREHPGGPVAFVVVAIVLR